MKRKRKNAEAAKAPVEESSGLREVLVEGIRGVFEGLPEVRRGANTQFTQAELAMTAFAVFHMQSRSFLEAQRRLESYEGRSNLGTFFRVERVPSDAQVRSVLDRMGTEGFLEAFDTVHGELERRGLLGGFDFLGGRRLIALDGLHYHGSGKIGCRKCTTRKGADGEVRNYHSAVTMALVSPDMPGLAVPLRPEFIEPQDGELKQDCEINAAKRAIEKNGERYNREGRGGAVLLGDDLYCHEPFCRKAALHGFHYILTCKEDSHKALYEHLAPLDRHTGLHKVVERRIPGPGRSETWEVTYAPGVPLTTGEGALKVNWLAARVTNEKGALYTCAWATDLKITEGNAVEIARAGRARWKIENEHNNTLKNLGYHLEHNFGHGRENLSCTLAALNILAFLVHTAMELGDPLYARVRRIVGPRRKFFGDAATLSEYNVWDSWAALLSFMLDAKLNGPKPHPAIARNLLRTPGVEK